MKHIVILGSTGSIGRQALQVVSAFTDELRPVALAAGRNKELLLEQTMAYKPKLVTIQNEEDARWLADNLAGKMKVDIHWGEEGLLAAAAYPGAEVVLTAISGAAGLPPTIAAIKQRKNIALANKETMVAAGELVTQLARQYEVEIYPVDSEHSAIWQCLNGENIHNVARIILTASGGPFRNYKSSDMAGITPAMALKHPNWSMGSKITIDSATLMNKGLEVIEARWLFNTGYDVIDVVIHPESIIHSMVEYNDGSVIAQMGVPDMRLPIQYALMHPRRPDGGAPRLQWPIGQLTFEKPDLERFPSLALAYDAGRTGGTMPAVLNAANEVAVSAFLAGQIGFLIIPNIVAQVMQDHTPFNYQSLEDVYGVDRWARARSYELVRRNLN